MGRLDRGVTSFYGAEVFLHSSTPGILAADVTCRLQFHSRWLVESVDCLVILESDPFHHDKNGFLARARATLFVTTSVHAPGEREGGRHSFGFSSFSALCSARSRASVKLDSDYSRTGHQFLVFATSFVGDFCVSALSPAILAPVS